MVRKTLLDTRFDLNYTYQLNLRFLLLHKLNLFSNSALPRLKKLALYSYIDNVETFWNNRALGSFLLLFFVTGNLPFISRFKIFQTFKHTTYSVTIAVSLNGEQAINFLLGFAFHLMQAASLLDRNFRFYTRVPGLYSFVLIDWVALKEITIHPAFFRWRENIFGKFFISNGFVNYQDFFMSLFKLTI